MAARSETNESLDLNSEDFDQSYKSTEEAKKPRRRRTGKKLFSY